ncbi:MAG: O-antigen ligase family protein [Bacteroidota bacterium]
MNKQENLRNGVLLLLALTIMGSVWAATHFRMWTLLIAPFGVLLFLQLAYDFRVLYYLLFFCIPFSSQLEIGTLSMDLPDEPLMILFTGIGILLLLRGKTIKWREPLYPFFLLVILLVIWMTFTSIISTHFFRSAKFMLAKLWYLMAFVFMANYLIQEKKHVENLLWACLVGGSLITLFVLFNHALEGFSFGESHGIVRPFFPNAVVYGAFLALLFPYAWILKDWYSPKSFKWWILIGISALLLIGIALSFRRGAWVAIALLPIVFILIKLQAFRWVTYSTLVFVGLILFYLIQGNTFYYYAPNYEKTIYHEGDISGHLSATLEGKELSGMERLYRWVAAKNMIGENLWVGTGPSTFNQEYKKYADDAFRTYVSDNPEQSTTHNYFLMTFAEQGIIGGALFLGLCIYMLTKAAIVYQSCQDPQLKTLSLAVLMSLITILFHSILNELIEVNKVGSFFWLNLVLIHKVEQWSGVKGKSLS